MNKPGRGKSSGRLPRGSFKELDRIVQAVARETGVPARVIVGRSRYRKPVNARVRAIALAYATDQFSSEALGAYFDGRDHKTIFWAIDIAHARGLV